MGVVPNDLHDREARQPAAVRPSQLPREAEEEDEEDDDSDSDEGLTMGKSSKKGRAKDRSSFGRFDTSVRRRDTNGSVGSTDTAKKLFVDRD